MNDFELTVPDLIYLFMQFYVLGKFKNLYVIFVSLNITNLNDSNNSLKKLLEHY